VCPRRRQPKHKRDPLSSSTFLEYQPLNSVHSYTDNVHPDIDSIPSLFPLVYFLEKKKLISTDTYVHSSSVWYLPGLL